MKVVPPSPLLLPDSANPRDAERVQRFLAERFEVTVGLRTAWEILDAARRWQGDIGMEVRNGDGGSVWFTAADVRAALGD